MAQPARVVLSMLTLVPGAMGGSETYARELVRELADGRAATPDLDLSTLVAPVGAGFSRGLHEEVAPDYPTGPSSAARAGALVRGTVLRRRLSDRLGDPAVVHYPFTVPVPSARRGTRSVVSLLDVQHHDLPHMFSRAERAYRSLAYDRAARRADAVVTISHFAKARIVERLGIDPARIHVAHLGVRSEEYADRSLPREDFLLYPAKGWPHKNHGRLLESFGILRGRHPRLRLRLTGARPEELPTLPAGVELLGQVSRDELAHLYATAAALVFPSEYEGFGLPVVEAMSAGAPVAAAAAGSLPEIVGDAGVLFDPLSPEDIARGVEEALERSEELRARGRQRAVDFSWRACAEVHLALYRDLARPPDVRSTTSTRT